MATGLCAPPPPACSRRIASLDVVLDCDKRVVSGCCSAPAATSAGLILLRAGWLRSDAARRERLVRDYMTEIYVPLVLRRPGTPFTTEVGIDRIEVNLASPEGRHTIFFEDRTVVKNAIN